MQEVKAMRGKVAKVLTRWKAAELSGLFHKWVDFCDRRLRAKYLCGKMVNAVVRRGLSVAWASWHSGINEEYSEALKAMQRLNESHRRQVRLRC